MIKIAKKFLTNLIKDDKDIFLKDLEQNRKEVKADLIKTGKEQAEELKDILSEEKLHNFYKSRVWLNDLPLFVNSEAKNTLFLGNSGSGKTLGIFEYISSIMGWCKKSGVNFTWIVYDLKHEYYTKMFRKEKDVLLFPKHADTSRWNIFREFNDIKIDENGNKTWKLNLSDLVRLVNYWLPSETDGGFNEKRKKALIASLITVSKSNTNPSFKDLIDFFRKHDTKDEFISAIVEAGFAEEEGYDVKEILTDTEAGTTVYEILMDAVKEVMLKDLYYSDEECNFSVKEFNKPLKDLTVEEISKYNLYNRNMDKRMILVQDQNNDKLYNTIFRIILELQAKTVLFFNQDTERRVFFLVDEFTSLGKMPCLLEEIPQKGRSKGAALILGLQSISSLIALYTETIAQSILKNIKTKVILDLDDSSSLEYRNAILNNSELKNLTLDKMTEYVKNSGYIQIENIVTNINFRTLKIENISEFKENKKIPKKFSSLI